MDVPSQTSLSAGQIVLMLLASALSGGLILAVVNWLLNWFSGRSKAEIVEIHARSVKLEAETQTTNAQVLMQAMERIRELVEINSQLQDELNETGRERDNLQYDLDIRDKELAQERTTAALREHFIQQLEAANKMCVLLKDLPPEHKEVDKAS